MATYWEQAPEAGLARWVECAWAAQSGRETDEHRVPPDGCLDIVYIRGTGVRAVGTMTVEQRFRFPAGTLTAGVRFHPGMAPAFLGVAAGELTDRQAALEDLWRGRARELERRLDDARSIQECMRLLLGSLRAPAKAPGPEGTPVERAIEAIRHANGDADLDWAAGQANLSARQFRRRCREESGLTPKQLCRVLRFRLASRLAAGAGERPQWSRIAAEAGYFDQAHLIRDWRLLTGHTPGAGSR